LGGSMGENMATAAGLDEIAAEGADKPDKISRRTLIVLVAGGLLVVGGGTAAYVSGLFDGLLASRPAEETAPSTSAGAGEPARIVFFELPDLVVSLNTNERKSPFLKAKVTLELADTAAADAAQRLLPLIIDYCQVYLRELRPDDLRGSAGTLRLREELRRRVAAAIAPHEVRDVLFAELLVQ
jgi:flagellar FliL protein